MVKAKRKSFMAREDLLNRLNTVAKQKGNTLYDTVNELFEVALKSEAAGLNLRSVVEENQASKTARDVGFTLVLESMWHTTSEIAYEKAKKRTVQLWFETGMWFAKRYLSEGNDNALLTLTTDLESFHSNIPEYAISLNGKKISIRVMNPRFSEDYCQLYMAFFEGILQTFAYTVINKECGKGVIRMDAIRREPLA